MADIFDLAPPSEIVKIAGTTTEVRPIPLGDCLQLVGRFPAMRKLLDGDGSITMADLLASGGGAALIAAGCGRGHDKEAEAKIDRLDPDVQAQFLIPILRLTMPNGLLPFLERVAEMVKVFAAPPTRKEAIEQLAQRALRKKSPSSSENTKAESELTTSGA